MYQWIEKWSKGTQQNQKDSERQRSRVSILACQDLGCQEEFTGYGKTVYKLKW